MKCYRAECGLMVSLLLAAGAGSGSVSEIAAERLRSCPQAAPTTEKTAVSYKQQKDVVFGEVDGVGLAMDIFTPVGMRNGLAVIDVASGAWYSDRGKIRDHERGQFFQIFCSHGYTVFAIRPGSRSRFSLRPEMVQNLRKGIHRVRDHAGEFGIDPDHMGLAERPPAATWRALPW